VAASRPERSRRNGPEPATTKPLKPLAARDARAEEAAARLTKAPAWTVTRPCASDRPWAADADDERVRRRTLTGVVLRAARAGTSTTGGAALGHGGWPGTVVVGAVVVVGRAGAVAGVVGVVGGAVTGGSTPTTGGRGLAVMNGAGVGRAAGDERTASEAYVQPVTANVAESTVTVTTRADMEPPGSARRRTVYGCCALVGTARLDT
jgi:hypothetical protein